MWLGWFCLCRSLPPPETRVLFSCQIPMLIWAFRTAKNGRKSRFSEAWSARAVLEMLFRVSLKHGNQSNAAWLVLPNMCLKSVHTAVMREYVMQIMPPGKGGISWQLRWCLRQDGEPSVRNQHARPKNASFAYPQIPIANLSRKHSKFILGDLTEEGKAEAH